MGSKRNVRRIAGIAAIGAGVIATGLVVHADTFQTAYQRGATGQDLALNQPPSWPKVDTTPSAPASTTPCTTTCTIDLVADQGTIVVKDTTIPGGVANVPFLGFGVDGAPVGLAGTPASTIKVPKGATLTINFSQTGAIADPIDLSFPSLPLASVSRAGNTYTIHADTVGTSVFQPLTNKLAPKQVAMGLVGVLIVTPTTGDLTAGGTDCTACAYDATVPYADEAVLALTDLDYEFATHPASFDMSYFAQPRAADGSPRHVYHLINGKAFPDTDVIDVRNGDTALLRVVNAGVIDRSIGLLGLRQRLIARNSVALAVPQTLIAPLVVPGETADFEVAIPTDAAAGRMYPLVDQSREMNHGTAQGFGGALTFLNVWAGTPNAPTVDGLAYDGTTFTATGHPSAPNLALTGFQTVANGGATPAEADWSALAAVGANGAISTALTAAPGQTIWVRVQQGGSLWSNPASLQVPLPPPVTIDFTTLTLTGNVLDVTATASSAASQISDLAYSVNDGSAGPWTSFGTPGVGSATGNVVIAGLVTGDTVYVKAADADVSGGSTIGNVVAVGPTVDAGGTTADTATDTLTITGTPAGATTITAAEVSLGASPAAAGDGIDATAALAPASTPLAALVSPATVASGGTVWVRVRDSAGVWSAATAVIAS